MTVTNIGVQRPSTALRRSDGLSAIASLRHHWPEYLMEMGELGLYLFVACVVATLLQHPASIVRQSISSGVARRALMGLVIGATAIAIVISPWGKRSGGHFNPAITFTFYRLGKVEFWDAWLYVIAQFLGAIGRCRSCQICVARRAWQSCGTLCGDSAGRVRKHCRVRGRIGDLFLSDDHCVVRHQSQKTGAIHRVFYGRSDRDLLHIRSTAVRHEHEPGTNIRLSTSRELLARALDLFHSSVDGHAGRRRGISSSPPGRRPILR
jgi:hypothetical protein